MKLPPLRPVETRAVDPARDRFRISWGRPLEALERSLRALGCLQPILLWNERNPEIVSGFRRVEAAERAGLDSLPAMFLAEEREEREVFTLALDLFLSTERPHPVEQSIIVRKLEAYFSRDDILERFFPRLGLNASAVIYRRIRGIRDLPERAQAALADGRLNPACVPSLELLSEADRRAATELLLTLRPSKSAQKEILEYLHDLTLRDGAAVDELLQEESVQEILRHQPANLPQQREAFRRWLKERRFPVLHRSKRAFEEARREWQLDSRTRLVPPPFYEGKQYEIHFSFRDPEEFKKRLEQLERLGRHPERLKKLWE